MLVRNLATNQQVDNQLTDAANWMIHTQMNSAWNW